MIWSDGHILGAKCSLGLVFIFFPPVPQNNIPSILRMDSKYCFYIWGTTRSRSTAMGIASSTTVEHILLGMGILVAFDRAAPRRGLGMPVIIYEVKWCHARGNVFVRKIYAKWEVAR